MVVWLAVALWCAPAAAQGVLKALGSAQTQMTSRTSDPLGRNTPRGTLTGFMQAAQKGDTDTAAQYLQLPRQASEVDALRMVDDLKTLLDHAFLGRLVAVTDNPDLVFDPQLDLNHERVGDFEVNGKELPLLVVRVSDGNSGYVWLVSWSTLGKMNDLASDVRSHELERRLPKFFVRHTFLSIALWVWIIFVLMIPVALAVGAAAVALIRAPAWLLARITRVDSHADIWKNIRGPVLLFATAAAHAIGMVWITVPLLFREYYFRVQTTACLFAVTWLLWDFINVWTRRVRLRLVAPADRGTLSLTLLLHRMLKVSLVVTGVFAILAMAGVNLSAALATLGIGGIALALAAQKTIENLFGGLSILSDRVVRVGDLCRVGETVGTVEDIGLRSTRIRTYERGLISVPNGTLATANVENLSARDKMRIFCKLGLTYTTTRDQLEAVLREVSALLHSQAIIEESSAWIRLARLSDNALELELQAYVLTREYDEFTKVREQLLLNVMDTIVRCGSALATPTQALYVPSPAKPAAK